MCRLLAYSANVPRAVEDLFDPGEFARFRKLSTSTATVGE
jgi:hypothetical protein